MKKLLFLFLALSSYCTLFAQLRLDVEGDAKILGRLDLNFGSQNVFIGTNAGMNTTTQSSNNTFIGSTAGNNNQGDDNTFIGKNAGVLNFEGNENTYIGINAGKGLTGNTRNVMLGSNATADDDLDKAIAIGYNAQVACDNCAVIGGTGVDATKVGIGTTTPTDLLFIEGDNARVTTKSTSGFYAGFRSIESTGDYFSGIINGLYVIYDNNASASRISVENGTGDVGIGIGNPSEKLDINGNVRIRNISTSSTVSGNIVRIDANGRLFINTSTARVASDNDTPNLIAEQKELINAKSREIDGLKTENDIQNETITGLEKKMEAQQQQIAELKYLVEKLLNERIETPKNNSLILPLSPKAQLAQNQPNPFRENTLVDYFVPANVQQAHLQVTAFDGKVIGKVAITQMGKGQVTIQSKNYPAGTYFYSLVLDGQVMETKRMVLAR